MAIWTIDEVHLLSWKNVGSAIVVVVVVVTEASLCRSCQKLQSRGKGKSKRVDPRESEKQRKPGKWLFCQNNIVHWLSSKMSK